MVLRVPGTRQRAAGRARAAPAVSATALQAATMASVLAMALRPAVLPIAQSSRVGRPSSTPNCRTGPGPLVDWARDERRSGYRSRRLALVDLARVVLAGIAVLLGLAGFAKMRRPGPSSVMLRAAGVPAPALTARVVALIEIAVLLAALAAPGRIAGAVLALAFAGLTLGAAVGARRAGETACGCFGDEGAPLGSRHVATNLAAALAAAGAALVAPPSLAHLASHQPGLALVELILAGILAGVLRQWLRGVAASGWQ